MSRIRSKETQAEIITFRYLRSQKIYFQKHYRKAPGTPDIALPRKMKAVFIDSDFWHGKDYERLTSSRNADDYWVVKIGRNIERDKKVRKQLKDDGWSVLVVWETDIKRKSTQPNTLESIASFLRQ